MTKRLNYTYHLGSATAGGNPRTFVRGTPYSDEINDALVEEAKGEQGTGTLAADAWVEVPEGEDMAPVGTPPTGVRAAALGAPEIPPRAGRGSGRDVWADFAEANGVGVGEDDSREEIIATLEARGIVEPE